VEYLTKGTNAKFFIPPVQDLAYGREAELDRKMVIDSAQILVLPQSMVYNSKHVSRDVF